MKQKKNEMQILPSDHACAQNKRSKVDVSKNKKSISGIDQNELNYLFHLVKM